MLLRPAIYLTIILLAAMALAACGSDSSPSATATPSPQSIGSPALTPSSQSTLSPADTPLPSRLSFTPLVARVGDVVEISGDGWLDASVTVYLVPKDDEANLNELHASGGLFTVGQAPTTDGHFAFRLPVPDTLKSTSGEGTVPVTPGQYLVAVEDTHELRTSGYLTITP